MQFYFLLLRDPPPPSQQIYTPNNITPPPRSKDFSEIFNPTFPKLEAAGGCMPCVKLGYMLAFVEYILYLSVI